MAADGGRLMEARDRLRRDTEALMLIPGLAGHEDRVRWWLRDALGGMGIDSRSDVLGNLIATLPGRAGAPSVMLFAHMDQLGFVVRRIEPDGLVRVERLGGVPERALLAQAVLLCGAKGDHAGIIGAKSHHATGPEEKYRVPPYAELAIETGLGDAAAQREAGIEIGTPVVYQPRALALGPDRLAGTSIDDRAGCAVLLGVARALKNREDRPDLHLVFSVQEEFNLRGVIPAAEALRPAIAIQLDLILATDTPDMAGRGEVALGGGPAMSLYSFHGRGTLNGLIPHPSLVRLAEEAARGEGIVLQRSAHTGALTETSYVQLVGEGVACLDLGFPMRHSHSALELCDLRDLEGLARLLAAAIPRIGAGFSLDRDRP